MAIRTQYDNERWQSHRQNWCDFWDHKLNRPMVILETFQPNDSYTELTKKYPGVGCPAQFSLDEPSENVIDFFQAQIESFTYYGDSWPKWFMNFGPGIIAAFLGANINIRPDTIWFEPPEGFKFADFNPKFDSSNPWYQRIMDLTDCALDKWQDQITVSLSDIGENLDILSSFRTTEMLLMDLYDCPDRISEYLEKLTALWTEFFEKFSSKIMPVQKGTSPWAPLWSPGKMYILQSDFSYMISPDMFEQFVLPDLEKCCDHLDHSFYHLDGKGQLPHLEMLLNMKNLHGVQWMPGEGGGRIEDYMDVLKKIMDAGKLSQIYATPEGALKIKDQLGGKGFVFHIVHNGMDEKAASELVNKLYE
ncbi:MAG: hypothetical protein ACYSO7_09900 [Planctomycetota bacterium]